MYDNYYLSQILEVLNKIYTLLNSTLVTIQMNGKYILISLIFFGLLFVAFRFIRLKRTDI